MSYNVIAVPTFKKEIKCLAKKYPSLKLEFSELITSLESNPEQGISIGNNCYKIRISIASKGKGKLGEARLITNVLVSETVVYLLSIYDKSYKENLTDKELAQLLKMIPKQ